MNLAKYLIVVFATLSMAASYAAAHDDFSPRVENGRLLADGYDDVTQDLTPNQRVFGYDFQEDVFDPYYINDPGFRALLGSGLPGESVLSFNIVGAAAFGLPANLSYWDGVGSPLFTAVPSNETLLIELGSFDVTVGSSNGDLTGFNIGTVAGDGTLHRHLNTYLLGSDGDNNPDNGFPPANGIYLVSIELLSSDPGIAKSLPMFIVFNNGLDEEVHDLAMSYAQSLLVPEPSSIALVALAGLATLRRRRA